MSDERRFPNEPFEKREEQGVPRKRRAREMVFDFMQRSQKYREPWLELAHKADHLYSVWESAGKSLTHRANLRLPYAYQVIETEAPRVVDAFLSAEPFFKIRGRYRDDMAWEDTLTDFCAMQLDQMDFASKFVTFVKSLLKLGTSVAKVPYRFEEREVVQRVQDVDPLTGDSVQVKIRAPQVMYDGPDWENIPLRDFFPDWASRRPGDIAAMRGCVHRTYRTLAELRASGRYENLEELERSVSAKGCDRAWLSPWWSDRWAGQEHEKAKKKPIELWEYWGLFDASGKGDFEERIIVVANGDVVIRDEENFYDQQFKPFIASVNVVHEDEFYGVSELFAIQGLIKEATRLRNSRLDQINLAVNRMWVVDRAAGVNSQALYSRPNGIVWANDINSVRELPPPEVPASSFREVETINNEIQTTTATASGPELSAAGKTFGRSATGANLVANIANSRISLKARMVSELALKPLGRIMLKTNAQFVSEDQWVRSGDPDRPDPFSVLPKDAFHTAYDFEIVTNIEADKAQEAQNLQMFVQFAQVAEQSQPGTINFEPVFEAVGRALLGRHVKKFTRSAEERQLLQAQQLAQEQAANAELGANAQQPNEGGGFGTQV